MIFTSLYTFALLFPLLLIFMQGPSVSSELALGTALALGGLYITRQMRELKRVLPYLAVLFVYLAVAYYWNDKMNDLTAKYTLGLICYLVPAGLLLREFTDRGQGNAVLLGTTLFSLCVAAVGLEVLRTVGIDNIVKTVGLDLSRSNIENESFTYLHYFKIVNVIIGMSTFAICALAGVVVLLLETPLYLKVVGGISFALALYTNIQVLTRGAVVSAALGIFGALPWIAGNIGPRRVFRYAVLALVLLGGLVAYAFVSKGVVMEKAQALVDRISTTSDDTRLIHWREAAGIIQHNLLGGGRGFMQTHSWAHNLFLDSALTAGLPGAGSVALFLMLAFLQIGRVLWRGRRTLHPVFLVFLAQFLAVFILTMTSPPNLPLFGFLLLGAGFFSRPYLRDDEQPA